MFSHILFRSLDEHTINNSEDLGIPMKFNSESMDTQSTDTQIINMKFRLKSKRTNPHSHHPFRHGHRNRKPRKQTP